MLSDSDIPFPLATPGKLLMLTKIIRGSLGTCWNRQVSTRSGIPGWKFQNSSMSSFKSVLVSHFKEGGRHEKRYKIRASTSMQPVSVADRVQANHH